MEAPTDEEMPIYFRLMKTVPFKVKKSHTIQMIRTQFSKMQDIPTVNLKSLSFGGDWLENERKVEDCNIKKGSIINVFLDSGFEAEIHVKISRKGKKITVAVDVSDTILTLKSKLQFAEDVPVSQQDLFYLGEELDDRKSLASYHIEGGSTVYAVFRLGDAMDIYISQDDRRPLGVKVKRWYTIENVKLLIESLLGIQAYKQNIYFGGVKLANDVILADLHISQENSLKLFCAMQIFVRIPEKTITIEVDVSYTIANVHEMIENHAEICTQKFSLFYAGKKLDPSLALRDYSIQRESTLELRLDWPRRY